VVLMLRSIAGGLGLLLIVVGGIFLGQGVELIGGSFMTGRGRWAVTGVVMIAFGICLLAAARYRDRGPFRNQHSHWRKRNPLSKCPLRCHARVSSACKPFG
jgi:hypothetical protein